MRKVILTSLIMLLFTISAYALEFEASDLKTQFYGQLHMSAFYKSYDAATSEYNGGDGIADATFNIKLHDYSRFGANLIFGNFSGTFELQPNTGSTGYFDDGIFRRYSISYSFANGSKLKAGKDWTPIGYSFDQYADGYNGLWGYGTIWENRQPLISYSIYGFTIAAIYNPGAYNAENGQTAFVATGYIDKDNVQKIPAFEASYVHESEHHDFKIYAAYTRFQNRMNNIATSKTSTLAFDTYIVGVGGQVKFAGAYVSATAFFGQNLTPYGILPYDYLQPVMKSATKITNVQSGGVSGAIGYAFNDMVEVSAGGGATFSSDNGFSQSNNNTMYSLFFNVPLQVTKFLKIIPEVSYFDNGSDFNKAYIGAILYGGVYLLAEF